MKNALRKYCHDGPGAMKYEKDDVYYASIPCRHKFKNT